MKVNGEENLNDENSQQLNKRSDDQHVLNNDEKVQSMGESTNKKLDKENNANKEREKPIETRTSKKKERLKRIRRSYQAELMKHMSFFQSARPYVELGSKPLSVLIAKSGEGYTDNGRAETVGPMEQLD